jgi:hypothetical protein
MKNNAMAIGVRTRIIYGALAIMTIILSMGENTMAQTKSVVKNIAQIRRSVFDNLTCIYVINKLYISLNGRWNLWR